MTLTLHEQVCIHEAAHALVATLLNAKVHFAEAHADGGGKVSHRPATTAEDKISISAAGPVADVMSDNAPSWGCAWAGDISNVGNHLEAASASELTVERACSKARDLLSANWPTVLEIASELEAMGRLPGTRIEQIIKRAATSRPAPQPRATVLPVQTGTARLVTTGSGTARISAQGGFFGDGPVSASEGYTGAATLTLEEAKRQLAELECPRLTVAEARAQLEAMTGVSSAEEKRQREIAKLERDLRRQEREREERRQRKIALLRPVGRW